MKAVALAALVSAAAGALTVLCYLAGVHYFGPEETLALLTRLVRELRPV